MFSTSAASIPQHASRFTLVIAGLLAGSVHASHAQSQPSATSWEFRVSSGSFVPTGAQRNLVKDGQVTAAQLSWLVKPSIAVTGTFAWARSRDLTSTETPRLDVFTSDLGLESRPVHWFANAPVSFSPLIGLGAGMRTYNSRSEGAPATNTAVGYAGVGGEFGIGRVGLRLEARDYVGNARIGSSGMHNDVVISAAIRFNRQRAQN